jgi:hypothetical protein
MSKYLRQFGAHTLLELTTYGLRPQHLLDHREEYAKRA